MERRKKVFGMENRKRTKTRGRTLFCTDSLRDTASSHIQSLFKSHFQITLNHSQITLTLIHSDEKDTENQKETERKIGFFLFFDQKHAPSLCPLWPLPRPSFPSSLSLCPTPDFLLSHILILAGGEVGAPRSVHWHAGMLAHWHGARKPCPE